MSKLFTRAVPETVRAAIQVDGTWQDALAFPQVRLDTTALGEHGLEVLDVLTVPDGTSPDVVAAVLKELESLWREKLADIPHY